MHPKAPWRIKEQGACLCVALAVLLPLVLPAQTQPPQSRLPVGPPGFHGWGTHGSPAPNPAPAPVNAKPSAAVPASQLPPMPVTLPPPPPPVPLTLAQKPAHRATVQYENGLLTVKAYNSSLNQILRAIIRETGLVVNGGVTDERVYGNYGPARVQTLLFSLLDGTNTNILYMPPAADQPSRLTLTSRNGGVPPPPSATASDDLLPDGPGDGSESPQLALQPNPVPPPSIPAPAANAVPVAPAAGPVPPAQPRTAEEIYQQILQMRAEKIRQLQAAPAAPAAPPK